VSGFGSGLVRRGDGGNYIDYTTMVRGQVDVAVTPVDSVRAQMETCETAVSSE